MSLRDDRPGRVDSSDPSTLEATRRFVDNPFFVLELAPDCGRAEIEREGQRLIGMLELGLSAASTYRSPLGVHERTPQALREAMATLRDPARRLVCELWAGARPRADHEPEPPAGAVATPPDGFALLGFGPARRGDPAR